MFDFLTSLIEGGGVLGVFLLMVAENLFPPIPSEVVMPMAGYLAADGKLPVWAVIAAGTAGSVLGALFWYGLGRAVGMPRFLALIDRIGPWLTLSHDETLRAVAWFERHGPKAVFLCRMVPVIRTLISVPAGLARMPLGPFLALTAAGSLIWVSGLTAAGYVLQSQHDKVEAALNPVTTLVLAAMAGTWAWRLVRQMRRGGR